MNASGPWSLTSSVGTADGRTICRARVYRPWFDLHARGGEALGVAGLTVPARDAPGQGLHGLTGGLAGVLLVEHQTALTMRSPAGLVRSSS